MSNDNENSSRKIAFYICKSKTNKAICEHSPQDREPMLDKLVFIKLFLAILTWKTHWEKVSKNCILIELADTKATRLPKLEKYCTVHQDYKTTIL